MVVAVRLLQADDDLVKLLSLLRQWQLRPQKIDQFAGDTNFSCLKSNICTYKRDNTCVRPVRKFVRSFVTLHFKNH